MLSGMSKPSPRRSVRKLNSFDIRRLLIAVALATLAYPVHAQVRTITCTGTLIDVWLKKNADWPLAVIYDAAGNYTCTIDRGNAGHDPLRSCSAGEKCRVTGTYRMLGVGEQKTYSIQMIIDVEGM
jgi:hypothetical protein